MDASESDIFIQKYASDFIADFDRSLDPFLRKPNGRLRQRVRFRETARLISKVLEHFQELPQLLDPHLPKWLPVLADAYLESLQERRKSKTLSTRSQLLLPLTGAICRIIYTFCKVRGEKVIVRFLNVETKYLELLLQAIEDSEEEIEPNATTESANAWTWHERYVVLTWLSQLFFAPFDLATISSGDTDEFDQPALIGFQWPKQVPRITLRVIPLATRYLASAGKERDGAKALLVRLAMRKDMQELGVLSALVQWALSTLTSVQGREAMSPYYFIGSLSFLAGVLRAAENTSTMDQHLSSIFYAVQAIPAEDDEVCTVINGSALARKMMIKVTRSIISIVLRKSRQSMSDTEMIETTIGYLLERLADNDTPVRLAASKALSIITLKLDPDMASQVIEAVIESLNRNVLWIKNKSDPKAPPTRDLAAVDPLEWHGLMLTLSHLLYRRSPPPEDLSNIIHALLIGLSFEKRGVSGGSIGTNVRDASCFGIWALARRYTTKELLRVEPQSILVAKGHDPAASILQVIATELVVTGSLDPAGNIRRGASAALQELIGRHPDTIEQGISVVQVVDYHSVALRARAIDEVALQATRLSPHYGNALLEATLGWRGIGDMDAGSRRVAAASFGTLTVELTRTCSSNPLDYLSRQVESVLARIQSLQVRQVEERHGLLLSLGAVLDVIPRFINGDRPLSEQAGQLPIPQVINGVKTILRETKDTKFRKVELLTEANSTLVISILPILILSLSDYEKQFPDIKELIRPGGTVVDESDSGISPRLLQFTDAMREQQPDLFDDLLKIMEICLGDWLDRSETEVIKSSSEASLLLLLLSKPSTRAEIMREWCDKVRQSITPQKKHGDGYFHALTRSHRILAHLKSNASAGFEQISIPKTLAARWAKDRQIETHVAIMQSITGRTILRDESTEFIDLIIEGLENYTTNARGDIGSHVRLEAIKATKTLWQTKEDNQELITQLLPHILRLAAEKLDRVRAEAQSTLAVILTESESAVFKELSSSSKEYFTSLLTLRDSSHLITSKATSSLASEICTSSLLAGLVTSADTGNEDLVIATRAALASFCETSDKNLGQVCDSLVQNLKSYAGVDRVLVPTLEVVSFLFHVGILNITPDSQLINPKQLCLLVQKAAYKTGNVRKLEACIKVYGALAAATTADVVRGEARRRLGALLLHPWPRVRSLVVDELWNLDLDLSGQGQEKNLLLLGVDWGRADKAQVKGIVAELGLV
ncbi:beta-tubulin cofactor d [Poronia punctata]|nr:beta-tubulin cofactor d [Poronia punctata]